AHNNLGHALQVLGRAEEALASLQKALTLRPDYAEAHWNRAQVWLQQGNFEQGWPEHEWRLQLPEAGARPPAQPRWDGSPLAGQRILLHAEQDMGDTLQFIRYAPLVKERGGHVIVACQRPLLSLLKQSTGIDELVANDEPLPDCDVQAPLPSLPGIFRTT